MTITRHALAYAQRLGWRIFLVSEDCRVPIKHGDAGQPGAWPHGVHDATADADELARRLKLYPAANIALACGPESGVLALDVDAKLSGQMEVDGFTLLRTLEAAHGPLPRTWTQRTPSGGAHYLFRFPQGFSPKNRAPMTLHQRDGAKRKFHGLDVRAAGASVALTPSVKPTGAYSWEVSPSTCPLAPLPDWLLDIMVSEPPPPKPRPPAKFEHYDKAARYCEKAIDGECRAVATTKSGRNQQLFVSACSLGELVGGNLVRRDVVEAALEHAAKDCGLWSDDGPHSVRATIKSGIETGERSPREVAL